MTTLSLPPLSLYIHIPWCVRKCPYCDFNSHEKKQEIPDKAYIEALLEDFKRDAELAQGRQIQSVFFGGGTPSLFPSTGIAEILERINAIVPFANNAEITLETNPGTAEYSEFDVLKSGGVNRLSFGAQSFDDLQLQQLGRIHAAKDIHIAIECARSAGFDNFNIDLMHSLPGQSVKDALSDIQHALTLSPSHLSWYQLTIEPNTAFFNAPPTLPDDDTQADIFIEGQALLKDSGFGQYEISAYSPNTSRSKHNTNYWSFGDYLAIGAGAHGKITQVDQNRIIRYQKTRTPADYLDKNKGFTAKSSPIAKDEIALEFMMNALRLTNGLSQALFEQRTGLSLNEITATLAALKHDGLLVDRDDYLQVSSRGLYFLNDILGRFMSES